MKQASDRGTYALVMFLPQAKRIRIGRLGVFKFPLGIYIYIGSAMNGLTARILRHMRDEKKLFWHIDYFLTHAFIYDVWIDSTGRRLECTWAHNVLALPNACIIAPRFGASDCDCPAHLIYLSARQHEH